MSIPSTMRAVVLQKPTNNAKPGAPEKYDPAIVEQIPAPKAKNGEVLIKLKAAALNHRDVYIRQGLYPSPTPGSVLAADGAGVVAACPSGKFAVGSKVYINSSVGWESAPHAPEDPAKYGVLGHHPLPGTLAEYISVPESVVYPLPEHLSFEEAAAIPLAGVTAWRALVTLGEVRPENAKGKVVLVPGIGGGVALFVLQFAVGMGAEVYVTSGDDDKLRRARALGAKGGVNYKNKNWPQELAKQLGKKRFDAVIDGSSGPNTQQYLRLLKQGGIISVFGAVAGSQSTLTMPHLWFASASIKGSMMGSNSEYRDMDNFIKKNKIKPVVSGVWKGLENAEGAFLEMKDGKQFGKVVISIDGAESKL